MVMARSFVCAKNKLGSMKGDGMWHCGVDKEKDSWEGREIEDRKWEVIFRDYLSASEVQSTLLTIHPVLGKQTLVEEFERVRIVANSCADQLYTHCFAGIRRANYKQHARFKPGHGAKF